MRSRIKVAKRTDRAPGTWTLWLALLAVVAVMLTSCAEEGGTSNTPEGDAESEGPARGVVVSDVADDPQEYTGATVTVSGAVNDIAAPNAFTIGGEDFLGTEELLILGAKQLPNVIEGVEGDVEVQEEDIVQVNGTVRIFDSASALEDEVDYAIDDQLFADYEGEPVVVAEKVWLTPQADRAGEDVQVSLADAADNPEEYYGQTVTLTGVVSETIEPKAFTIVDQDMASEADVADLAVLVVGGSGASPNLTEGQAVQVTGTFQEFELSAFEGELGTDLDDGLYVDWEGRPAIAAEQIQQTQGGETTMMSQ